jgi:hypothetical protein
MGWRDWLPKRKETGPDPEDVGPEIVEFLFDSMHVDDEWSVRESRGFTWWAHTLAQRVWAEPPRDSLGTTVVRVHAQTALFREVAESDEALQRLGVLNQVASLSAFILDPGSRRVALHCAMTLHAETLDWGKRLLAGAVGAQAADAHVKADTAPLFQGTPDTSSHPRNGLRPEADDMLNVLQAIFVPKGAGTSPFTGPDLARAERLLSQAGVVGFADAAALTAEFPFTGWRPAVMGRMTGEPGPPETALLRVDTKARHPQLGSGAFLHLALPVNIGQPEAAAIAMRLNRGEATQLADAHFLGAWCPDRPRGLAFVSFMPAAVYRPGLLDVMIMDAGLQARWAREALEAEGLLEPGKDA